MPESAEVAGHHLEQAAITSNGRFVLGDSTGQNGAGAESSVC
jgi:hypothetical protein